MKFELKQGEKVRTSKKTNRAIKKGRINSSVIEEGIIEKIEHFGRIIYVKVPNDDEPIISKPEYLELNI